MQAQALPHSHVQVQPTVKAMAEVSAVNGFGLSDYTIVTFFSLSAEGTQFLIIWYTALGRSKL